MPSKSTVPSHSPSQDDPDRDSLPQGWDSERRGPLSGSPGRGSFSGSPPRSRGDSYRPSRGGQAPPRGPSSQSHRNTSREGRGGNSGQGFGNKRPAEYYADLNFYKRRISNKVQVPPPPPTATQSEVDQLKTRISELEEQVATFLQRRADEQGRRNNASEATEGLTVCRLYAPDTLPEQLTDSQASEDARADGDGMSNTNAVSAGKDAYQSLSERIQDQLRSLASPHSAEREKADIAMARLEAIQGRMDDQRTELTAASEAIRELTDAKASAATALCNTVESLQRKSAELESTLERVSALIPPTSEWQAALGRISKLERVSATHSRDLVSIKEDLKQSQKSWESGLRRVSEILEKPWPTFKAPALP